MELNFLVYSVRNMKLCRFTLAFDLYVRIVIWNHP